MALRINFVLLLLLALAWGGLRFSEPVAIVDAMPENTGDLAHLEDAFARDPHDVNLARGLATAYLEMDRPGLAISIVKAAHVELLDDAQLLHRLAQAYERTGRLRDANQTAELALDLCARSLGTGAVAPVTPVPRFECSERVYAALDLHAGALARMVRMGVTDSAHDARVATAYAMASRTVHVEVANAQ